MDSARQVIRWALPGWVAYLFWFLFTLINCVFSWIFKTPEYHLYFDVFAKTNSLLLPLGIASIPLGFIIHQFYYWFYWDVSIPYFIGRFILDPTDRGRYILSDVEGQVDFKKIFRNSIQNTPAGAYSSKKPLAFRSIEIMNLYRINWHLSDSAWYLALSSPKYKDTKDLLERRNSLLSDIYHSLGACYAALTLSLVLYAISTIYVTLNANNYQFLSIYPPIFLSLLVFIFMIAVFRSGRISSFDALLTLKHDVITRALLDNKFIPNKNARPPHEG